MPTELPEGLQKALEIVGGARWPEGDEDGLDRMSDAWSTMQRSLQVLDKALQRSRDAVSANMTGAYADAHAKWIDSQMRPMLDELQQEADNYANLCKNTSADIQYTKTMIIVQLSIVAATLAFEWLPGIGQAITGAAVATARVAISQIMKQVLQKVLSHAVIGAAAGAGLMTSIDAAIQGMQMLTGERTEWNEDFTKGSAMGGALAGGMGGALSGGVRGVGGQAASGALGKGARNFANSRTGRSTENLAAAAGQGVGEVGGDAATSAAMGGKPHSEEASFLGGLIGGLGGRGGQTPHQMKGGYAGVDKATSTDSANVKSPSGDAAGKDLGLDGSGIATQSDGDQSGGSQSGGQSGQSSSVGVQTTSTSDSANSGDGAGSQDSAGNQESSGTQISDGQNSTATGENTGQQQGNSATAQQSAGDTGGAAEQNSTGSQHETSDNNTGGTDGRTENSDVDGTPQHADPVQSSDHQSNSDPSSNHESSNHDGTDHSPNRSEQSTPDDRDRTGATTRPEDADQTGPAQHDGRPDVQQKSDNPVSHDDSGTGPVSRTDSGGMDPNTATDRGGDGAPVGPQHDGADTRTPGQEASTQHTAGDTANSAHSPSNVSAEPNTVLRGDIGDGSTAEHTTPESGQSASDAPTTRENPANSPSAGEHGTTTPLSHNDSETPTPAAAAFGAHAQNSGTPAQQPAPTNAGNTSPNTPGSAQSTPGTPPSHQSTPPPVADSTNRPSTTSNPNANPGAKPGATPGHPNTSSDGPAPRSSGASRPGSTPTPEASEARPETASAGDNKVPRNSTDGESSAPPPNRPETSRNGDNTGRSQNERIDSYRPDPARGEKEKGRWAFFDDGRSPEYRSNPPSEHVLLRGDNGETFGVTPVMVDKWAADNGVDIPSKGGIRDAIANRLYPKDPAREPDVYRPDEAQRFRDDLKADSARQHADEQHREMEAANKTADWIAEKYPPDQFNYVGLGRSPAPVVAALHSHGHDTRSVPLSDFRPAPHDPNSILNRPFDEILKQPHHPTPEQHRMLDQHFEEFLGDLPGNKDVLLIDYTQGGLSLVAAQYYLQHHLNGSPNAGSEVHALAMHQDIDESNINKTHALTVSPGTQVGKLREMLWDKDTANQRQQWQDHFQKFSLGEDGPLREDGPLFGHAFKEEAFDKLSEHGSYKILNQDPSTFEADRPRRDHEPTPEDEPRAYDVLTNAVRAARDPHAWDDPDEFFDARSQFSGDTYFDARSTPASPDSPVGARDTGGEASAPPSDSGRPDVDGKSPDHTPNGAERPSAEDATVHTGHDSRPLTSPDEWGPQRDNAPVSHHRTERFDPTIATTADHGGNVHLAGNRTRIDHDIRRFQDHNGNWIREYTVTPDLAPHDKNLTPDELHRFGQRVKNATENNFNGRYRLPDSGDQLHIRVEPNIVTRDDSRITSWFDDSHQQPYVKVHNTGQSSHPTQLTWDTHHPDGPLAHEIMHLLGLGEGYTDHDLVLRHPEQDGVMGRGAWDAHPGLTETNLADLERISNSGPVIRDHPLQNPGEPHHPGTSSPDTPENLRTGTDRGANSVHTGPEASRTSEANGESAAPSKSHEVGFERGSKDLSEHQRRNLNSFADDVIQQARNARRAGQPLPEITITGYGNGSHVPGTGSGRAEDTAAQRAHTVRNAIKERLRNGLDGRPLPDSDFRSDDFHITHRSAPAGTDGSHTTPESRRSARIELNHNAPRAAVGAPGTTEVPKNLHMAWFGNRQQLDGELGDLFHQWQNKAIDSDWQMHVWVDHRAEAANRQFLDGMRDAGAQVHNVQRPSTENEAAATGMRPEVAERLHHALEQDAFNAASDITRYWALHEHGGAYLDSDIAPGRFSLPHEPTRMSGDGIPFVAPAIRDADHASRIADSLQKADPEHWHGRAPDENDIVDWQYRTGEFNNNLIVSPRHSPFLNDVLNDLPTVEDMRNRKGSLRRDAAHLTGPHRISERINQHLHQHGARKPAAIEFRAGRATTDPGMVGQWSHQLQWVTGQSSEQLHDAPRQNPGSTGESSAPPRDAGTPNIDGESPAPPAFSHPDQWGNQRDNAPVSHHRTERFDPTRATTADHGGNVHLAGNRTRIDHDIRRFQDHNGNWIREYTVTPDLARMDATVTPEAAHALGERVRQSVDTHLNGRYRLPDSGDQLHIRVEPRVAEWNPNKADPGNPEFWAENPDQRPYIKVYDSSGETPATANPTQLTWGSTHDGDLLAHEVLHFLGLGEGYADPDLVLRHPEQAGAMGRDIRSRPPFLVDDNLAELERISNSGPAIRDHPLRDPGATDQTAPGNTHNGPERAQIPLHNGPERDQNPSIDGESSVPRSARDVYVVGADHLGRLNAHHAIDDTLVRTTGIRTTRLGKISGYHGVKPEHYESVTLDGVRRPEGATAGNHDADWKAWYLAEHPDQAAGYGTNDDGAAGAVLRYGLPDDIFVHDIPAGRETDTDWIKRHLGVPHHQPLMDYLGERGAVLRTLENDDGDRELIVPWNLAERGRAKHFSWLDRDGQLHLDPDGRPEPHRPRGWGRDYTGAPTEQQRPHRANRLHPAYRHHRDEDLHRTGRRRPNDLLRTGFETRGTRYLSPDPRTTHHYTRPRSNETRYLEHRRHSPDTNTYYHHRPLEIRTRHPWHRNRGSLYRSDGESWAPPHDAARSGVDGESSAPPPRAPAHQPLRGEADSRPLPRIAVTDEEGRPALTTWESLPEWVRGSRALGSIAPHDVDASGLGELVRGMLPEGPRGTRPVGVERVEPTANEEFESFLGHGRSFPVRSGKQWYEAHVRAVFPDSPESTPDTAATQDPTQNIMMAEAGTDSAHTSTVSTTRTLGTSIEGGPLVGPYGRVGLRAPLARPSLSRSDELSSAEQHDFRTTGGTSKAEAPVRFEVRLTDANGTTVPQRPETPTAITGRASLQIPHELGTFRDPGQVREGNPAPGWAARLDHPATEAIVLGDDRFHDVAGRLHPSITRLGAPGRQALEHFLSSSHVRGNFGRLLQGWVLSPDLVSAHGNRGSAVQMTASASEPELVGVTDAGFTRAHDSASSSSALRAATKSGFEGNLAAGGSAISGSPLGGAGMLTAGRWAHSTATNEVGGQHTSKVAMQVKGDVGLYEANVELTVLTGNGEPIRIPATAHMRIGLPEAAEQGLPVPHDTRASIAEPTAEKRFPPPYLAAKAAAGNVKVSDHGPANRVLPHVQEALSALDGIGDFLPRWGNAHTSPERTGRNSSDEREKFDNQRKLAAALSPGALRAKWGALLGQGADVQLKKRGPFTNDYVNVRVRARIGDGEHLGEAGDRTVRASASTAPTTGTSTALAKGWSAGVEGRMLHLGVVDHHRLAVTPAASLKYTSTAARTQSANPSETHAPVAVGSPTSQIFRHDTELDVEITSYSRPRAWVKRLTPGSPMRTVPEPQVLARTVRDGETAPEGARALPPISGKTTLWVPDGTTEKHDQAQFRPGEPASRALGEQDPRSIREMLDRGDRPGRTDALHVEAVTGTEFLRDAALGHLDGAAGGDGVLGLPGSASRKAIDDFFSPEHIAANLGRLTDHGGYVDGLHHDRRVHDRVGSVGMSYELKNPTLVSLADDISTENSTTGGHAVGETTAESRGWDFDLSLNHTARPEPAPADSTSYVGSAVAAAKPWSRSRTRSAGDELSGTVERTRTTPERARTALVRMDADVTLVAESQQRNILHSTTPQRSGSVVTLPGGAFLRVDEEQARALGVLPDRRSPEPQVPESERLAPPRLFGRRQPSSIGLSMVDTTPDLRGLLGDMRAKLGDRGAELLPDSVLDDAMRNQHKLVNLTSPGHVQALQDSALDGGITTIAHAPGFFGRTTYWSQLRAQLDGEPEFLDVVHDGVEMDHTVRGSTKRTEADGKTSGWNLGLRGPSGAAPGTGNPDISSTAGTGAGAEVSTGQQRSTGTSSARTSKASRLSTASGPAARYQVPIRFELVTGRGDEPGTVVSTQTRPMRMRVHANNVPAAGHEPAPVQDYSAHAHERTPADAHPEAIRAWRQEDATTLPHTAVAEALRGSTDLREGAATALTNAGASKRITDLGTPAAHALRGALSPEMLQAQLVGGRTSPLRVPHLHAISLLTGEHADVEVHRRLSRPRLVGLSDHITMADERAETSTRSGESSHTGTGAIAASPGAGRTILPDPDPGGAMISSTGAESTRARNDVDGSSGGDTGTKTNRVKVACRSGLVEYDADYRIVATSGGNVGVVDVHVPASTHVRLDEPGLRSALHRDLPETLRSGQDRLTRAADDWREAEVAGDRALHASDDRINENAPRLDAAHRSLDARRAETAAARDRLARAEQRAEQARAHSAAEQAQLPELQARARAHVDELSLKVDAALARVWSAGASRSEAENAVRDLQQRGRIDEADAARRSYADALAEERRAAADHARWDAEFRSATAEAERAPAAAQEADAEFRAAERELQRSQESLEQAREREETAHRAAREAEDEVSASERELEAAREQVRTAKKAWLSEKTAVDDEIREFNRADPASSGPQRSTAEPDHPAPPRLDPIPEEPEARPEDPVPSTSDSAEQAGPETGAQQQNVLASFLHPERNP